MIKELIGLGIRVGNFVRNYIWENREEEIKRGAENEIDEFMRRGGYNRIHYLPNDYRPPAFFRSPPPKTIMEPYINEEGKKRWREIPNPEYKEALKPQIMGGITRVRKFKRKVR